MIKTNKRIPILFTGIGLVLFTLFSTFFNPMPVYGKIFPNVDYVDWNHDVDHNRIDDRLEAKARDDTVDAVVLFNRCLTPADTEFVATYVTIDYIGQYVQGIWVEGVLVSTLLGMLDDPHGDAHIFRIEQAEIGEFTLDVSCPAVKARQSATYSPSTAWDQGFTGSGVVIGILDSGVDDLTHSAFVGKYVGGYDAETNTAINPVDVIGHGTHVAGIALGVDPNGTYLGVARDADLVDVKVGTNAPSSAAHARAIDWCIANRHSLGIDVLNLSYSLGGSCNGKCADCMAVDAAVDRGLVVCVAAGNNSGTGWIPSPAAADRSIAVGALDDQGTVLRNDETHAGFSNSGPRVSDNDDDTVDEEKPDVVAPGVDIMAPLRGSVNLYTNKSGTSMATPHVVGVAAILLSAKPSLSPDDVKATLRETSTDAAQNVNPAYTTSWGKGEVDAWQAIQSGMAADLYINSWVRDMYTPVNPPRVGVTTNLNARVRNNGPNAANGVAVLFFTNRNNVGYGGWTQIGQTTVNVPSGGMTVATVPWTPLGGHQCIRARAVYSGDPNVNNNQGQDNFDPVPSEFFVEAGTPFTGPQLFRLNIDAYELLVDEGWWAKVWSEDDLFDTLWIHDQDTFNIYFDITDDCCPRIIRVDINHPPEAPINEYSRLVLQGWVDTLMVGQQTLMSYVPEPGAVQLNSFYTEIIEDLDHPSVKLLWTTATEIDNAGFNIHRSLSEEGECVQINEELILVQGSALEGASYSFTDCDVVNGTTYYYKLEAVALNGGSSWYGPVSATCLGEELTQITYGLWIAHPIPINRLASITYSLPKDTHVKLSIYDVTGRQVRELVSEIVETGRHAVVWHGEDVPSGVYFCRMSTDEYTAIKKIVLLK